MEKFRSKEVPSQEQFRYDHEQLVEYGKWRVVDGTRTKDEAVSTLSLMKGHQIHTLAMDWTPDEGYRVLDNDSDDPGGHSGLYIAWAMLNERETMEPQVKPSEVAF